MLELKTANYVFSTTFRSVMNFSFVSKGFFYYCKINTGVFVNPTLIDKKKKNCMSVFPDG